MKIKSKFQDEDFEVGEIVKADIDSFKDDICLVCTSKKGGKHTFIYNSLDSLREEWEDAPEEPKLYWYIDDAGVVQIESILSSVINMRKSIGNYFNTREEAEKAVKKLKAWKRLKDKGFEIVNWTYDIGDDYHKVSQIVLNLNNVRNSEWDEYEQMMEIEKDLDLLFSGGGE